MYSFSSSFTDFDDDGYLDLAIAMDFGLSRFYWNNGDGTFTDGTFDAQLGKEENGMGLAIGYFGEEQKLAMLVTSIRHRKECDDSATNFLGYRRSALRYFEVTIEHVEPSSFCYRGWLRPRVK